jgi:hypothetical protein
LVAAPQKADIRSYGWNAEIMPVDIYRAGRGIAAPSLLHIYKINSGATALQFWMSSFARHEALRAREQQFLGLRIRESCCACTGSKFQEYWQTVFGSPDNG